jgi:hypothetical protein
MSPQSSFFHLYYHEAQVRVFRISNSRAMEDTKATEHCQHYRSPANSSREIDLEAASELQKVDFHEYVWRGYRSRFQSSFNFTLSIIVFLNIAFRYSKSAAR